MKYTGCTQCATPQCATLSLMCNIFLRNLCFAPCPQCATVRKNFNSKMTKMNGNGLNMVFKMIKLTSKAVFYHLYQNILPLFTINWPLFFKMDKKKPIFYQKLHLYFFRAMSPMCNNVPNVQHFFGEFRCCTLGAPGVPQKNRNNVEKFVSGIFKFRS